MSGEAHRVKSDSILRTQARLMEAARCKALLQRQLAQAGAPPALSLSAQEAARLQGFLDGEEVRTVQLLKIMK